MTSYYISTEFHTMPATTYADKPIRGCDFHYAIRRSHDKSLVFRADKITQADELLKNLTVTTAERSVA